MINEIRAMCRTTFNRNCKDMGIYLVRFDGQNGILKCNHVEKDNAIRLLNEIKMVSSKQVDIETIGTSGTIKSLIKKHMNG